MKYIIGLFFSSVLFACEADSGSNSNGEEKMFGKNTKESYVISSPIGGVIKVNGKPVSNAKISRRLRWNGNDEGVLEESSTDENGLFTFPVHEESLSLGVLGQFVSSAKIEVEFEGRTIDVWYNNKFEKEIYAEIKKPLVGLVCDLGSEEVVVESGLSKIMTICRWVEMPEF